ncbi:MAG: TIGR02757 family protein [Bacteroidetes bacterium]|nr:TIGR02757 family protein [Bacteroidota bacterium]
MKTNKLSLNELKEFLDEKYNYFNSHQFIQTDPICIPHQFNVKEDIEISAFLIATIAWGQRASIIKNGNRLMQWMDNSPYHFILHSSEKDLNVFNKFVHRTFNGIDCIYFLNSLKNIYKNHSGLEQSFYKGYKENNSIKNAIVEFRAIFFELKKFPTRTLKHVSNPADNSAAKRLNMFLRWMVRKDHKGVDFGIWRKMSMAALYCPLDIHTGNTSRELGLLFRKQNDWKAVEELTNYLRMLDSNDPIKYDFALFGLGAIEKF